MITKLFENGNSTQSNEKLQKVYKKIIDFYDEKAKLKHHFTILKLAKSSARHVRQVPCYDEAEKLGLNQILIQENIAEMIQMNE